MARFNFELSGNTDLQVEIQSVPVCFMELKKSVTEKDMLHAQAEACLFLADMPGVVIPAGICVLTDLRDDWRVMFVRSIPSGQKFLRTVKVNRRTGLGAIRTTVLLGLKEKYDLAAISPSGVFKRMIDEVSRLADTPLSKRIKVSQDISGEMSQLLLLKEVAEDDAERRLLDTRINMIALAEGCDVESQYIFREIDKVLHEKYKSVCINGSN
ncbi:hypothetical protein DFS34DRAFT_379815 [Phlyctochytrium arcticum]|nr:hypothetical protein DFS34DRAFT_379815 [Phlyctochytrium arcticum]